MSTSDPADPTLPAAQAEVTASGERSVAVNAGAGATVSVDTSDSSRVGVRFGDNAQFGAVQISYAAEGDIIVAPFQPAPMPTAEEIAAAQELMAALPLDTLPPPAPLPEIQRMPLARNPLFVGREADLRTLALALKGEGEALAIGPAAATTGLGGIGKTNLASEFVHRYGPFFAGGVFWLSFANPSGVPVEVAACGAALDLPGFADLKLDDQVRRVQSA